MYFMIRPEYQIAFKKATQVNQFLSLTSQKGKFVSLDDIVKAVLRISDYAEINIDRIEFSKLDFPKGFDRSVATSCGAMLNTTSRKNKNTQANEKVAQLIINADFDANMQRFSVVHELGHLIAEIPNFVYETVDDGRSTLSAHINADITYFTDEQCADNKYLIAEQVANIFALLVLIPRDIKIRDIKDEGVESFAEEYGVTEDAIYSRMLLSSVTASSYKEREVACNEE